MYKEFSEYIKDILDNDFEYIKDDIYENVHTDLRTTLGEIIDHYYKIFVLEMTKHCKEQINVDRIEYKCEKENHRDASWHKSEVVRIFVDIDEKTHKYIMLSATWRTEVKHD